jgi:integral membrane protein
MQKFFTTQIGRLRLLGFLEGMSLLILIGIAMPLKYIYHEPGMVKVMGSVHGLLFLLFVINTLSVGVEYKWKFTTTTWKVLLACIIPFGTFYVDKVILSRMDSNISVRR